MNADKAIIVTTSTFSNVARQTVAKLDMEIELVDRAGLNEWIKKYLIPADGSPITLPPIPLEAEQQNNQ
jgi:restriction endonuclease Mrr